MSAAVRKNSVCGPGCPEIVAVDNGIALPAVRRGPLSVAARKPATTVIGESAQGLFGLHGPPFRPGDLGLAHVVRMLVVGGQENFDNQGAPQAGQRRQQQWKQNRRWMRMLL